MRLFKIALKTLVLLLAFCLGFILSELRYTTCPQCESVLDDFFQFVYLYDTEQKLEDYYQMRARVIFDQIGLHPESPEAREAIALVRSERPLVIVGPFAIFVNNDSGEFSVREMPLFAVPLLIWTSHEQSKSLIFVSSVEEYWDVPRFLAHLHYSEEGVYERGIFTVAREDGTIVRAYFDDEGIGVFDRMLVYRRWY